MVDSRFFVEIPKGRNPRGGLKANQRDSKLYTSCMQALQSPCMYRYNGHLRMWISFLNK